LLWIRGGGERVKTAGRGGESEGRWREEELERGCERRGRTYKMSCRCFCSFDLDETFRTDRLVAAARGVEVAGVVLLREKETESSKRMKREGREEQDE